MATFVRLLSEGDKGAALACAMRDIGAGLRGGSCFVAEAESFRTVPGAPFAYWVGREVQQAFIRNNAFEAAGRAARRGPSTCDDVRYVRCWWESYGREHGVGVWKDFSKGGAYSPFYADIHLQVDWEPGRGTFLGFFGRPGRMIAKPESVDAFFRPGLTWPRRTTSGLALRAMPAGCIFADKGPAAFVADDDPEALLALLAVTNSAAFKALVAVQLAAADAAARSYEVGVIQRTPVPDLGEADTRDLADLARRAWSLKRAMDTAEQTSHAFTLPAILQAKGDTLGARASAWAVRVGDTAAAVAAIQSDIDERCFALYGFAEADRAAALGGDVAEAEGAQADEDADEDEIPAGTDVPRLAAALVDWLLGVALGRFDIRLATGERVAPSEPGPFDPLPACSPGMLTGADGLPLQCPPTGYPLAFPPPGILVDDPGLGDASPAQWDAVRQIREALHVIWAADAGRIEAELTQTLGAKSLRDWLRRPNAFFAEHLSRYSRSRRKAPIYWPLSTDSGRYTLWLYYPRLTDQTLYTCVNEHLDPKLAEVAGDIQRLRGSTDRRDQLQVDDLVELQRELAHMREELLRVAALPYRPDQNDGVLITAAPLRRLFRHTRWRSELEKCWQELESGQYDWAHLALAIWPERVRERCRTDRSIAIAHDREDLYEG